MFQDDRYGLTLSLNLQPFNSYSNEIEKTKGMFCCEKKFYLVSNSETFKENHNISSRVVYIRQSISNICI